MDNNQQRSNASSHGKFNSARPIGEEVINVDGQDVYSSAVLDQSKTSMKVDESKRIIGKSGTTKDTILSKADIKAQESAKTSLIISLCII